MRNYRYARLNPTGNLTCLVLEKTAPEDEPEVTRELLNRCEQVAYLEPPRQPGAAAAIRLMGGEFCGNAAMAAATWLVRNSLATGEETEISLEVSGAKEPVVCRVRKTADGFEGTVGFPGLPEIRRESFLGVPVTAVRMEGILHLVCEQPFEEAEAEEGLRKFADAVPDEAVGLLQWDSANRFMKPLVYVKGSGSMVWEHGCGSGSAAVCAAEALGQGDGMTSVPVRQPGGTITAAAEIRGGRIRRLSITGKIGPAEENTL